MNAWIADRQVLALSLQATVLSHARVREAATAFATELANGRGCARVSVGFVRNGTVRLVAVSHGGGEGDSGSLQQQAYGPLTAAMDEAVQQGTSVCWPAEGAPAVRLAHRALLGDRGGAAASIPIVHLGQFCGAITCEWTTSPLELAALVDEIENIVSLAGPVLLLMHHKETPLHQRLADSARHGLQRLREGHRAALVGGLAFGAVALAALLALPVDHRVGGRARIEGEQQRSLVVPLDGFLKAVHARPGDRVQAGQVLVEMADQDLALQRRRWTSELGQQENAYASAIARADRAAMVIALARADEARAQLALVEAELARTRITAPFAGIVVDGDLTQSLGAPLERGKPLMLLAPLDRYRVMVQVDERDIGRLRVGQSGSLSLAALPWDALAVQVTRVTPVARAVEGRNVFEVETDVRADIARIRPGLEGVAKIDVGRAPLAWVWLHRVAEWARLAWWSWTP
jgi:multidrug resistance efflux pump